MPVKVIDLGWKKLVKDSIKLDGVEVHIGFPAEGDVKPGSSQGSGHDAYTSMSEAATVAFMNDQGVGNPRRSFMGPAIDNNLAKIKKVDKEVYNKMQDGLLSPRQMALTVGLYITDLIKAEITELSIPANSALTEQRKGSSNPLIDTAQVRNTVQPHIKM